MTDVTITEPQLTEVGQLAIGDCFEYVGYAWMVVGFICCEGDITSCHIKRVACDDRDTVTAGTNVRKLKLVKARFERE